MRKQIKRYFVDYSFSVIYAILFYSPLGLIAWKWSVEQTIAYIISTFFVALISGRLYGALLNKWRGIFGERRQ